MVVSLGSHLLTAAVLAAGVAILCRLARPRPAVCHALWLLVLLKLLVPPGAFGSWTLPVNWPQASMPGAERGTGSDFLPWARQASGVHASPPAIDVEADLSAEEATDPREFGEHDDAAPPCPEIAPAPAGPHRVAAMPGGFDPHDFTWAVFIAWALGAVVAAGRNTRRLLRMHGMLSGSRPPPDFLGDRVIAVAGRLGVRPPRVRVVEEAVSPMLWCLGRPCLVWPATLSETLEPEAWSDVIAHELAHLKRRDHWVSWLALAGASVWWWNPLFWIVRRELRHWAELACDAWVVWCRPASRRRYAQTLIEVSRFLSRAARPLPAMGMSAAAFRELERRLIMILNGRTRERVGIGGVFLIALLALAVLPGLTFSQEEKKPGRPAGPGPGAVAVTPARPAGVALVAPPSAAAPTIAAVGQVQEVEEAPAAVLAVPNAVVAAPAGGGTVWTPLFAAAQASGPPNTFGGGHRPTAWTPKEPDAGTEWLSLRYRHEVRPLAVRIYETQNPGAVVRVVAVLGKGRSAREVLLWEGEDPLAGKGRSHGVAAIHCRPVELVTQTIKIYLDTARVKGRNAIDAVELLGEEGAQFAAYATASSSLPASRQPVTHWTRAGTYKGHTVFPPVTTYTTVKKNVRVPAATAPAPATVQGRTGIRSQDDESRRLEKLERELAELKRMILRLEQKLGDRRSDI